MTFKTVYWKCQKYKLEFSNAENFLIVACTVLLSKEIV